MDALAATSGRTSRLARLQAAGAALAAGRPLGALPDAPPALARFATTAPPTEASLRLAFPAAAQAALAASRPDTAGKPFLDRLWTRTQALVTVRQGDKVIVGDPAGGVLAAARARLDAGDLRRDGRHARRPERTGRGGDRALARTGAGAAGRPRGA